MPFIIGIIILIILGIIIWFNISYSPIKSEFVKLVSNQLAAMKIENENFTEEDILKLPVPVQKYFRYCGYIGKPKMSNMKIVFNNADFVLASRELRIRYIQYNFVIKPIRYALIKSSIFGIPFEGIDSYHKGIGCMRGQIAKLITVFCEKGDAMNKACIATYLSECLLMPNAALQEFITWQYIDENHVKATINYYGTSASGIFEFDEKGCMKSFTTDDREYNDGKGNIQRIRWSAICEDYKDINGIKYPTVLKAIWHLKTGDLVYFNSSNMEIKYDVINYCL